jgi:hypothetical protein
MIRALVIIGGVAVAGAVAAGVWVGKTETPPESIVAVRQNAPLVARPGREAASAAKTFAKLDPPPPPVLGPAKPPPPDVAVVLRHDVRALAPDQGRVVLAGAKTLKLGDKYADGWKLAEVTNRTVTVKKGKEARTVDFFQPDPAAVQALAAQTAQNGAGFAQVSFTNGLKPGQLPASVTAQLLAMMRQSGLSQAQIDAMKKQMESGAANQATLMPIVMAMARNGRVPIAELDRFVESLGRAGFLPEAQTPAIEQSIQAVAQSRATDGIIQQLNRPDGRNGPPFGPGGRAPGQGFNGGGGRNFGGGGGGGRRAFAQPQAGGPVILPPAPLPARP